MAARQPPPGLVDALNREFGSGHDVRWNEIVCRWEVISPSAAGRPVSQFFGYLYDPNTGKLNPPDTFGLLPFRDLDADGMQALFTSMRETSLVNPHDGDGNWKERHRRVSEHNQQISDGIRQEMAEGFALMLSEFDLKRPWLKHHSGTATERRVARGIR